MITSHQKYLEFIKSNHLDQDVVRIANKLDEDFEGNYIGLDVLVVGCNEDPFANVLSELGANVIGLDLREYSNTELSTGWEKPLYEHIVGDAVTYNFDKKFDLCVSISVVEHIGLGWIQYGGVVDEMGDAIAMRNMASALKDSGNIYITVPIGGSWKVTPHWRRYTLDTISRLIGDSEELHRVYFATSYNGSGTCTQKEVEEYHSSTDISILLKLGIKNGI